MDLVQSKFWHWLVDLGLLIAVVLTLTLLSLNLLELLPKHSWSLDFVPLGVWIILAAITAYLVNSMELEIFHDIKWLWFLGGIAFWLALVMLVFSLREKSLALIIFAWLGYLAVTAFSFFMLEKYSAVERLRLPFKPLLIMSGCIFVNSLLAGLLYFWASSVIAGVVFIIGLYLIYFFYFQGIFGYLEKQKAPLSFVAFLAFTILSLLIWTLAFTFFGYVLL